MTEEANSPEKDGTDEEPTIEQIVNACRAILPPEDLEDLAQMERDEALIYLLTYLPEFGIDDPQQFMETAGIAEGFRQYEPDEIAARNSLQLTGKEYMVDEIDEETRRKRAGDT